MKNNSYPEISVIIPVFNCDKYISYAVESVLNQTYGIAFGHCFAVVALSLTGYYSFTFSEHIINSGDLTVRFAEIFQSVSSLFLFLKTKTLLTTNVAIIIIILRIMRPGSFGKPSLSTTM